MALTLTCQSEHEARFELGADGSSLSRLLPLFRCLTSPVRVPESWVTSKQAVNFFSTWCAARSWVFQPVDASNDFGKDGYVDITDENGRLTGELFSVQVKGGESWTAAGGYRIPVGKHRDVWMNSTVPVIGIVHDPRDGRLRWVNLTAALREDRELASVHVPDGALLDEDEQLPSLMESVRATTRPGLPMALGSDSDDEQEAAVWDCFAIARRNADALIAVRRCFLALGGGDGWPDSSLSPSAPHILTSTGQSKTRCRIPSNEPSAHRCAGTFPRCGSSWR